MDYTCVEGPKQELFLCKPDTIQELGQPSNTPDACVLLKSAKPLPKEWETKTKTTCSHAMGSFETLEDAKAICNHKGSAGCGGVLDDNCGKSGARYSLCYGSGVRRQLEPGSNSAKPYNSLKAAVTSRDASHCVYTSPYVAKAAAKAPVKCDVKPQPEPVYWNTVKNKDCDTLGKTKYNSHAEAKAACEKAGSSCGGVMDYTCVEGPKQELFLCK